MQLYSRLSNAFKRSGYFKGKSNCLQIWKKTYKNKYVSPEGYHDWSFFSKLCFWLSAPQEIEKSKTDNRYTPEYKVMIASLATAIMENAPGLFLSLDLMRYLSETRVPAIDEPPELPFPVFCVLMDKKVIMPEVYFREWGTTCTIRVVGLVVFERPSYISQSIDGPDLYAFFLALDDNTGEFKYLSKSIIWSEEDPNPNDCTGNLVKNIILLYNNKRELFTEEKTVPARGTGFGKASKQSDPEPTRFIGKFFENKVRYVGRSRGDKGGAKKRPHWRRGHWHKVCHGEGRKERKYQWFQPVYVCPSEEDSSEA